MLNLREKNLSHLDIKPCNIMINEISKNEYSTKFADFGTARVN